MIAVVGAGVAGLATALALDEVGLRPHVFESAGRVGAGADDGGLLHVNPAGQRALAQLGVGDRVAAAGFPVSVIDLRGTDGTQLGRFPAEGGDYRYIARSEMVGLLVAEIDRRGIPISYGRSLVRVEPGARPLATFADAEDVRPDLVVGADGPWSAVRNAVDPTAPVDHTGQWFVHGATARTKDEVEQRLVRVVRDSTTGHAFGWTTSAGGTTHWWLRATAPPLAADGSGGRTSRDRLIGLAPPGCPGARLIAESPDPLAVYDAYAVPPGRRWSSPGVALVGDAVHACSPAASQAVALAAEDAVALAAALRGNPVDRALEFYEWMRRGRAERAIAAGDPRRGLTAGPEYELDLTTTIDRDVARALHDRYA